MKTNDIFNFRRFGNYLLADGKSCFSRFGLDLLIFSLSGLGLYLLLALLHFFGLMEYISFNHFTSIIVMGLLFVVLLLCIGPKCYGHVTEKRAGSLYTLVPVSTLEKTFSILIWSFVLPLCFLAVYLGIDWILSLLDPNYGSCIVSMAANARDGIHLLVEEAATEGFDVRFMTRPVTYLDDMMNLILIFVLGALCFKKNKVAMTILSVIAIGLVTSSLATPFILSGFDPEEWIEHAPFFYEHLVFWDTFFDLLGLAGLTAAIFFRLKKIHY